MKQIKNYICLVDSHRSPERMRNTAGRYRVGAKSSKEAKKLLHRAIGFGSVQVYCEDTNPETMHIAKYKECLKESNWNSNTKRFECFTPALHANTPHKKE